MDPVAAGAVLRGLRPLVAIGLPLVLPHEPVVALDELVGGAVLLELEWLGAIVTHQSHLERTGGEGFGELVDIPLDDKTVKEIDEDALDYLLSAVSIDATLE